jgi:hypothetical protein
MRPFQRPEADITIDQPSHLSMKLSSRDRVRL